jgi:hypothetical protein
MEKVSFSDSIGIAGIILAVVLLVLDKAGKLKGGWLFGLLCVAGAMTLFLAIGNSFVLDAPAKWRVWRGLLMVSLVGFTYSGIAIWIADGHFDKTSGVEPSLALRAFISPVDPYPDRMSFAGIIWLTPYFDTRLDIVNGSTEIKDLDFLVRLDTSIAGLGQISQFPGVTAFPAQDIPAFWLHGIDANGTASSLPITATPGTMQLAPVYRVHCSNVLANTTVHLAIASLSTNPATGGAMPKTLFSPRRAPKIIQAKGSYSTGDGTKHPLEFLYEFTAPR